MENKNLNEFTIGKRWNGRNHELEKEREISVRLPKDVNVIYNTTFIPKSKSVDLFKNICRNFKGKIKFEDSKEFKYWLYNIQDSYRSSKDKNRKYDYQLDAELFGKGYFSEDGCIFLPPQIKILVDEAARTMSYDNTCYPDVEQTSANVYRCRIKIMGYDKYYEIMRSKDILMVFAAYILCREFYYKLIAIYANRLGLIDNKTHLRLRGIVNTDTLEMVVGKRNINDVNEILTNNNVFSDIEEIVTNYSYKVLNDELNNIVSYNSIIFNDSKETYESYLRKYKAENWARTLFHSIEARIYESDYKISNRTYKNITIGWKNSDEFIDWFFNKQTTYIVTNPAKDKFNSGDNTGYVIDKDLFFNGTYGPDSCVFIPHILNNALVIRYDQSNKLSDLPPGVRFKDNWYRVVIGFLGSAGDAGIRVCTVPKCEDPRGVGFCIYKYAREFYIHMLAKELYKRKLIPETVYSAVMRWTVYDPEELWDTSDINKKIAFDFMLSRTPSSGRSISYKNYFAKLRHLFKTLTIPKIDEFEDLLIKPKV